ncbi:MAG: response regulator [Desulfovibrio sp.]|nr:response regulator [Desulfovibrio sp.]
MNRLFMSFTDNPSIKRTFRIFSIIFYLTILIVVSVIFLLSTSKISNTTLESKLSLEIETIKLRFANEINSELTLVLKMADTPLIKRYLLNPEDRFSQTLAFEEFSEYRKNFKSKSVFWVSDIDKQFYLNGVNIYTVNPDDPDEYWYYRTLYRTEKYNFVVQYNPAMSVTNLWVNAPVFENREPIGLLGTGIELSDFINTLYRNRSGTADTYLVDETGEITVARNQALAFEKTDIRKHLGSLGDEIMDAAGRLVPSEIRIMDMGDAKVAISLLPQLNWYIIEVAPISTGMPLDGTMTGLFVAAVLLIALIFIVCNVFIGIMKDAVDERNRELVVLNETAQAASKAKSEFLASMSHEIRTPMNAVMGMTDLMRTDNLDETQRDYLSNIKKMSRTLLNIINDILDFSKIESGKMELVQGHYDLHALYDNICSLMQFIAAEKDLRFVSSIDETLPRTVYGDEGRVRQIVINLVTNAVKYTHKGCVTLHFRRASEAGREYLAMEVRDTGVGIKQEDFPRLFAAFEQLDGRKNRGITGTGLGLSITKRLADLMDGEIRFESEYGAGSAFTVLLPLTEGDLREVESAKRQDRCHVSPDAAVLVVDDNAANLTVALGFLARHGIRADTASSGEEAIAMVDARHYDLVFMDHMMPGMDGIEAVQRIRATPGEYYEKLPIVALSANVVLSAREAFFKAGMNDFISKPIAADELNAALIKWLPPEKLPAGDTAERTEEDDGAFDGKLRMLETIGDLDVALGLSRTAGNKAVYIDILRRFCTGLDRDIADIRAFMGNAAWKDYSVRLHSIKSVFANFGNRRMTEQAFSLESASLSGDVETCLKGTESFCGDMANFRAKLLESGIMDSLPLSKKSIDADALILKLKLLEHACFEFNTDEVGAAGDELRRAACGTPDADALLAEICDLADSLDYDGAAGKCRELAALLERVKIGNVPAA